METFLNAKGRILYPEVVLEKDLKLMKPDLALNTNSFLIFIITGSILTTCPHFLPLSYARSDSPAGWQPA
jgi:hypothetical protein